MFDNLNSEVVESSELDLVSAFGEESEETGSKKPAASVKKPIGKADSKKTVITSKEKSEISSKALSTAFSNDEDVDEVDEAFGKDDKKPENKVKKAFKPKEEIEEEEVEEELEEENEEETEDGDEEEVEEETEEEAAEAQIKDFLKVRAELLISKGEWADFEGREEFEWNEDSFAEMDLQQRQYQRSVDREEMLDSFGPYGREIAEYAANGGDADELIDIFKEQSRVEHLSLETEEDQRSIVLKYETEFLNKKPERVKKYIDSLIADKELAAVAQEAKEAMEESLLAQAKELQAGQQAKVAQSQRKQIESIKKFQSTINDLVGRDDSLDTDEKRQLLQVLTKFDKKLKNGTPVNEWYFIFDKIRKDPQAYLRMVRHALNPDKYEKKLANTAKAAEAEKSFKLARTAAKTRKTKSADMSGGGVKTKFKLM